MIVPGKSVEGDREISTAMHEIMNSSYRLITRHTQPCVRANFLGFMAWGSSTVLKWDRVRQDERAAQASSRAREGVRQARESLHSVLPRLFLSSGTAWQAGRLAGWQPRVEGAEQLPKPAGASM